MSAKRKSGTNTILSELHANVDICERPALVVDKLIIGLPTEDKSPHFCLYGARKNLLPIPHLRKTVDRLLVTKVRPAKHYYTRALYLTIWSERRRA